MATVAKYDNIHNNRAMVRRVLRGIRYILSATVVVGLLPTLTYADPQSTNFRLSESSIGSGSTVQSSSANYRASDAVGDISIGNSASTNFQVNAGTKTPVDPNLTVNITSGAIAFPSFSAASPSITTATFSVQNYTSYGYVVQIIGTPPTNPSRTITPMAASGPSVIGIEQFGMNLVANTSPSSFGANPDNGSFGFGGASGNYGTPNSFRYVSGETIALASKSSGITNYTISYLVNVAGLTPGGQYVSNQTLIITGTY